MKNSLNHILEKLLKANKINIDYQELSFQIESHPSYSSLHSITGVLNHFKIENVAAKTVGRSISIDKLPKKFLLK